MKTNSIKKLNLFVMAFVLAVSALAVWTPGLAGAAADTCTWTGAGEDDNFSTSDNWTGCDNSTVPEAGDSLVFPMTVASANRHPFNDLPEGTSFAGIQFTGTNNDCTSLAYTLAGNSITLTGSLTYDATGGCVAQVTLDLIAGANVSIVSSSSAPSDESTLIIGPPDGSGTVNVSTYTLTLQSAQNNLIYFNSAPTGSGTLAFKGPGDITPYHVNFDDFAGNLSFTDGSFSASNRLVGTSAGGTTVGNNASLNLSACIS